MQNMKSDKMQNMKSDKNTISVYRGENESIYNLTPLLCILPDIIITSNS